MSIMLLFFISFCVSLINRNEEGGEVTFHFYSGEKASYRVRDIMSRLLERKRLGNFTLSPTYLSMKQEPSLLLQVCYFI